MSWRAIAFTNAEISENGDVRIRSSRRPVVPKYGQVMLSHPKFKKTYGYEVRQLVRTYFHSPHPQRRYATMWQPSQAPKPRRPGAPPVEQHSA